MYEPSSPKQLFRRLLNFSVLLPQFMCELRAPRAHNPAPARSRCSPGTQKEKKIFSEEEETQHPYSLYCEVRNVYEISAMNVHEVSYVCEVKPSSTAQPATASSPSLRKVTISIHLGRFMHLSMRLRSGIIHKLFSPEESVPSHPLCVAHLRLCK